MNGPVCLLCGVAHWSHESHKLGPVTVRPDVMRVLGSAYKAKVVVGKTADTGPKTPDKVTKPRTITPDKPRTRVETADKPLPHNAGLVWDVAWQCEWCKKGITVRPTRGPLPRFCSDACRKRASRT